MNDSQSEVEKRQNHIFGPEPGPEWNTVDVESVYFQIVADESCSTCISSKVATMAIGAESGTKRKTIQMPLV